MVGAFLCLERSGLFLCPFLRKEVSAVANRIIRCGGKALTRCRSKVHDTFDTIQHVGGFPSGHRHIVHGIRSLGCRELGLRTHLTSLCVELVEILSGCTGHGGYLAHRRIEIGCCFYSSNAKNCNCSRGRKELFTGGGNLIACRLQAFTSSSVLPGSSFRNFSTSLSWFYVFLISEFTPFKAVCSLVVSLPISTVIPLILLPAIGSSSLQNGYKNCPAFLPSIKKAPIRFLRPMIF